MARKPPPLDIVEDRSPAALKAERDFIKARARPSSGRAMRTPPDYWRNEIGSDLRPAVLAYLHGDPLSEHQIATLHAYLHQWIWADVWARDRRISRLRRQVDDLTSRTVISWWLADAVEAGIDPL